MTVLRPVVLALAAACVFSAPAHAIIGGAQVGPSDPIARQTVLLVTSDRNGCTGTLIGTRSVLTAAHCLQGSRSALVAFIRQGQIVAISPIVLASGHPGRQRDDGQVAPIDVAIATMRDRPPAGFVAGRLGARDPAPGTRVTIAGFGRRALNSFRSAGDLLKVDLPVIQQSVTGYKALGFRNQLGSGRAPSACQGDSGGPAFAGGAVVGVISLVSGPPEQRGCGALTIAMPVVSIAPWIRGSVARNESQAQTSGRQASLPRTPVEHEGLPEWARRNMR